MCSFWTLLVLAAFFAFLDKGHFIEAKVRTFPESLPLTHKELHCSKHSLLRNYNQHLLRHVYPRCRFGSRYYRGFDRLLIGSESPNKRSTSSRNFDQLGSINCPVFATESGFLFKSCDRSFCEIRNFGYNAVRKHAVLSSACPSVVCSNVTGAESRRQCILERCCGTEIEGQPSFSRPVPVKRGIISGLSQCIYSHCSSYTDSFDRTVCIISNCRRR